MPIPAPPIEHLSARPAPRPAPGSSPRSTPIPGSDPVFGGAGLPGNVGAAPPPSPSEFASGGPAPYQPGVYQPAPYQPGVYGVPYAAPRRRRSVLGVLGILLLLAGPVAGIGGAVWAFLASRDAVRDARDLSDPDLSDADRAALGLPDGVTTLFEQGAAGAVVDAFEDGVPGVGDAPTRFVRLSFYSDYAFAEVQDAAQPAHVDRYPWRSGRVGASTPELTIDDPDAMVFSAADVDWSAIAGLVAGAPAATGVEQGTVSHVIVDRSTFDPSLPITIRIYVTGPRGSGFVEASATGVVLAVY